MQSARNNLNRGGPPPSPAPNKNGGAETHADLRDRRILIVDDDGIHQLQLKRILRSQEMEIVGTASDGLEALSMVMDIRPDIVLMDIEIPGIDGLEASERILQQYPVCIVILSAFSDVAYYQRADAIGVSGYIVKPVAAETLLPQLLFAYRKFLRTRG